MPAPPNPADRFAEILADYDDQRRHSGATPLPESDQAEYGERLREAGEVLDLLDALWSRKDASSVSRHADATPALTVDFPADTLVGRRLNRYQILGKLGSGGMGTVYKVRHEHLQRLLALKIMKGGWVTESRQVERFLREMQAAGTVDHPNVIRATDAGEEQGLLFLVMELVEGKTLDQLLRNRGPFPLAPACEIVRQTALGLQAIAEHRLVHRDIKPSNLMLSTDGVVKILDLGLARMNPAPGQEELTSSDVVLGTFDYQAPEQAGLARSVDVRADLYSLGCTWYKLMTGQAPYVAAQTPAQKIHAHAHLPMPNLPSGVPAEVHQIFARLTAKDPDQRLASGAELAQLLEPWCRDHGLKGWLAQPTGPDWKEIPVSRPAPRLGLIRRIWPRLLAGGLLIGGVSLLAVYWIPREQTQPATPFIPAPTPAKEKPPPADPTEPRVLNAMPKLRWINLLDQKPFPVVYFPTEGLSNWHHDADAETMSVISERVTLLSLGRIDHPHFTLKMAIRMTEWAPGAGLFLGYQAPHKQEKTGKVEGSAQILVFGRMLDPNKNRVLTLARGRLGHEIEANGRHRFPCHTVHEEILPGLFGEQILEVKVVHGRIRHIRLDDRELATLNTNEVYGQFGPEEHLGVFGTINMGNTCTYRNIRIMLHDEQ